MLSAGSKRKVWIAAALASGAKITLIDDLTAALDRGSIEFIIEQLITLTLDTKRHIVISHYDTLDRVPFALILDI
jgi:energy-coupling factor transporter ATP-binding protein EcfA2